MEKRFTIRHTNIIKGIAVILLLFHHLFYKLEYFDLCFTFSKSEMYLYNTIAIWAKVCVSIFLLLSGYGLTVSAGRIRETVTFRFSLKYIIKLLLGFWIVYLLFVPLGFLLGRNPVEIYGAGIKGILKCVVDFFGISHLTHTPTFNATWWFMGEIIRLYVLFPILYYGVKTNTLLMLFVVSILFYYGQSRFLPFVVGMIFAEKDIFAKFMNLSGKKKFLILAVTGTVSVLLRFYAGIKYDILLAIWIALCVLTAINPENLLGKIFEVLGKHSGNIFMLHSFIYYYYFKGFIYGFYHPAVILSALLLSSLGVSWIVEQVKKLIRIDRLANLVKKI